MTDLELIKKYVKKEEQEKAIVKLNEGYPVQYIIGNVEFYNIEIDINENVLIPRFETEYLVEKTLNYISKLKFYNPEILEIGSGSGCIPIAIKKNLLCDIDSIDINPLATSVAIANAKKNNVDINFEVCDIHSFKSYKKYDIIISNPPYVPYNSAVDEKIKYEPNDAIYAKDNGLYFYKIILEKVYKNLNKKYLIAFEIGDNEGKLIEELVKEYFNNCYIKIEKDYNNYERYLFISSEMLE